MKIFKIRDGIFINVDLIESIVEDYEKNNRWYITMRSGNGFSMNTEEARKLIEAVMLLDFSK